MGTYIHVIIIYICVETNYMLTFPIYHMQNVLQHGTNLLQLRDLTVSIMFVH